MSSDVFAKINSCCEAGKSGGIVADILLAILLFVTLTASMFDMAAFYTAFSVLAAAILLKAAAYWFYSRQGGERPL